MIIKREIQKENSNDDSVNQRKKERKKIQRTMFSLSAFIYIILGLSLRLLCSEDFNLFYIFPRTYVEETHNTHSHLYTRVLRVKGGDVGTEIKIEKKG